MSICDSSGAELLVEYSDDASLDWDAGGHDWEEVGDVIGSLEVNGGDKSAEEFRTFGKVYSGISGRGMMNLVLEVVFKNDTDSFLEYLTDTWDGTEGKCFYLRWAYNDGEAGALRRTAKVALLTNPFTGGNASDGRPVTKSLTFAVDGDLQRDTVPAPPPP